MRPNSKLHCVTPIYETGGGGIKVSKVIQKLGGTSQCTYLAGEPTGTSLTEMVSYQRIEQQVVPRQNWTREN